MPANKTLPSYQSPKSALLCTLLHTRTALTA